RALVGRHPFTWCLRGCPKEGAVTSEAVKLPCAVCRVDLCDVERARLNSAEQIETTLVVETGQERVPFVKLGGRSGTASDGDATNARKAAVEPERPMLRRTMWHYRRSPFIV